MRYALIRELDISNGEGIRVSLFVQGCDRHCEGCFNPETWDWNSGKEFTHETLTQLMKLCDNPHIKGLSILGGEPLHPNNRNYVDVIIKTFRKLYPAKDIWLWTGYTIEQIENLPDVDYLIDGSFVEELKDPSLHWRGSKNQNIWQKENDKWEKKE